MYKQGEDEKKYHEAYKRDCNAQGKVAKILRGRAYFEHDFLLKIEVKYKTYARCPQ